MSLSCEEADALLSEYAVGAISPDEMVELEDHLVDCRNHDVALAEYRSVVAALAHSSEEIRPPRRLRGRLLTAFDQEARTAPAAGGASSPFGRLPWWRRPELAYGLAAVLLFAVIGLAAWNLSLRNENEGPLVREARAGTGRLTVVYFPDQHLAVLDFDLPPPGADRTYQAWRVPAGGAPISLGLLGSRGPVAFRTDLVKEDTVAVSLEPPGGSTQPTTTPLIAVGLSGSAGAIPSHNELSALQFR